MKNHGQEAPDTKQWVNYNKEMATRKIAIKDSSNIIRWGKCIKGIFMIIEGYHMKAEEPTIQTSKSGIEYGK